MARLKHKLPASSLVECVVASVIWMGTFMLVMEILIRVTFKEPNPDENLIISLEIKRCYLEYVEGNYKVGKYTRCCDWGTLEIELEPYLGRVRRLTIEVCPFKGENKWKYKYLIKSMTDE